MQPELFDGVTDTPFVAAVRWSVPILHEGLGRQ